ncbi:MAG: serine/threonine-protein kinase [Thermoanaerobaculia bacterium]|nr:serine/threonine-protein kinase [Thermoanaerobaculia bacterium]
MSTSSGTAFDGKYEILERLGGGGMGEVFLVRHIHLEEKRVIKTLRRDRVRDPEAQKRFLREARFATQIKNPHVAILYDYSQLADGSYYMVWEYIAGEDVGSRLRSRGPFPVGLAVELGIQALRGLAAIHAAGMIHRDVSPDNLMISDAAAEGRPLLKIIDLGLAKNLDQDPELEVTQDGMFMGKLLYCAPEQAGLVKGEILDHRSDLYSFSLVLYEMLTGRSPFDAETPQGSIFRRLSEDPLPLVGRNPQVAIPVALDSVVLRGLARERDKRWPDAASYISALEAFARSLAAASTQEIELPPGFRASAAVAPPPAAGSMAGITKSELSRAERLDLLAQIERAANRLREGSKVVAEVDALIAEGRLREAFGAVTRLEQENPRSPSLPELKQRLLEAQRKAQAAPVPSAPAAPAPAVAPPPPIAAPVPAAAPPPAVEEPVVTQREVLERLREALRAGRLAEAQTAFAELEALAPAATELGTYRERLNALAAAADRRRRVDEAEAMVKRYLQKKQLELARLALSTLVELQPDHRGRADYEACVQGLAEELQLDRRAAEVLAAGREALTKGDVKLAKKQAERLERIAPDLADRLVAEIAEAETVDRRANEVGEVRERLEKLLEGRRLAEVRTEIDRLGDLGVSRVTVELYRSRLVELVEQGRTEAAIGARRKAFEERVAAGDFQGAREVVGELQEELPGHELIDELLGRVSRLEQEDARARAITQGVAQIEKFIVAGDAAKAELALRVLVQMDPENRRRKQFEKQIEKLRG